MNWPDDYINKVICGDCLQIMRDIPDNSVDLVLTDPPYGISRDKGFGGFGGFGKPIKRREYTDDWDGATPDKEIFDLIIKKSKRVMLFGGNFFTDKISQSNHWIFWDKKNTMPTFGDGELIWTNIKRNSVKKYTVEYNGLIGKEETRSHPTQKPLKLLSWLIGDYSEIGDLILDPFLGSGTTAVAAKQLGRKFIGIEISEKYCKIAEQRLAQEILL